MRAERFEVYGHHLPHVDDGIYSITWAKENNLCNVCFDLMHGRIPKNKIYRYGLFGTSKTGFNVKRKRKDISEQEQDWEEVARIKKV